MKPEAKVGTLLLLWAACLVGSGCGSDSTGAPPSEAADPPEVAVGERLFRETRFAQFFFAQSDGRTNVPLAAGDPVMDVTVTRDQPLPGPFAGQSMNCRACHLVDEQGEERRGGVRTYADFARRSPVPARGDGRNATARNSPPLVNATLPRDTGFFLHFDGEFASLKGLVEGTFTGRNFGWLPTETAQAAAHIAHVIRDDDGQGPLASEFGALPYRVLFKGTDPSIPDAYRLPEQYRFDVDGASDVEILAAVANVVGAYVESLVFAQDDKGAFKGSPYDRFLRKNQLPTQPERGESDIDYTRRLRGLLIGLRTPNYVSLSDGSFELHAQEFRFGPTELRGLKIFLAEPDAIPPSAETVANGQVGNCVACHAAPNFTDFQFHNTGAAQDEYDGVHDAGAFAALEIPGLTERNAAPDEYLPPSAAHPGAQGPFLDVPSADRPGRTDLGLWNVFANPAVPAPQSVLLELLCGGPVVEDCTPESVLPTTIALFKTPGLRSLGQSAPYLHTGQKDTLEDVVDFYIQFSNLARVEAVRNAAPQLRGMAITSADSAPLAAFLRSLNEDYQ